uniref:Uncharacterized protein n=1 Tax=Glossina pallidipes TaxID=7398 RepID=A0A1A9ZW87_GLOPL
MLLQITTTRKYQVVQHFWLEFLDWKLCYPHLFYVFVRLLKRFLFSVPPLGFDSGNLFVAVWKELGARTRGQCGIILKSAMYIEPSSTKLCSAKTTMLTVSTKGDNIDHLIKPAKGVTAVIKLAAKCGATKGNCFNSSGVFRENIMKSLTKLCVISKVVAVVQPTCCIQVSADDNNGVLISLLNVLECWDAKFVPNKDRNTALLVASGPDCEKNSISTNIN